MYILLRICLQSILREIENKNLLRPVHLVEFPYILVNWYV